jgi:hypothetical protein
MIHVYMILHQKAQFQWILAKHTPTNSEQECPRASAFFRAFEKVSQSSGRRERKSHPVQRLKRRSYFANLEKPGKEQSLLATTICTRVTSCARVS